MVPRKIQPVSMKMEKLTIARLSRVKKYDPAPEHAEVAFHSLSKADKMRALAGEDERNFAGYDKLPMTSVSNQEARAQLNKASAREVEQATKMEMKQDFKKMGIKWAEPERVRLRRSGKVVRRDEHKNEDAEEDEEFWSDPFEDRPVKKGKAKGKVACSASTN